LYRDIASSKVITSSTSAISQISSRYLLNIDGLVTGKIFGDLLGSVRLIKGVKRRVETLREVSIEDFKI